MKEEVTKESFLCCVASHQMTVHRDDGTYRHLTFANPETWNQHFHITTWPGHLAISGDMGTYVYARLDDMFHFFRNTSDDWGVNHAYWSKKLEAPKHEHVREFDIGKVHENLRDEFEGWERDFRDDYAPDTEEEAEALEARIQEERELFQDLLDTGDEWGAVERIREWDPRGDGVCLDGFFEGDYTTPTYHYVWCCYAIVWAIRQYDASQLAAKEAAQ
ncbi:hypothetical protein ABKY47_002091 [Aeromonas hydrophila]